MKLFEVNVPYHKDLNPKLWNGMKLKPDVRKTLMEIADSFIEYLDVKFDPEDIILTGSAANYNWTAQSDLDLHLITNIEDYKNACPEFAEDFFSNKKTLWNEHHDITIHDMPVEIYVQDSNEAHFSTGVYSVKNDEWITEPKYSPPEDIDEEEVDAETAEWKDKIDDITQDEEGHEEAEKLKDKLREYRKKGLEKDGEFATANLVFKELRRSGHIEKLIDYIHSAKSDSLSLD